MASSDEELITISVGVHRRRGLSVHLSATNRQEVMAQAATRAQQANASRRAGKPLTTQNWTSTSGGGGSSIFFRPWYARLRCVVPLLCC